MSDKMSRFIKRILGRDPAKRSALEYITTIGIFGDQVAGMENLSGDDIIDQSAKFAQAFIPYLNTRKDKTMFQRLVCYLENYEMYTQVCDLVKKYEDQEDKDEEAKMMLQELTFTKNIMRPTMESDGKIILSLTFPKIDPKTIVLDKPYILAKDGTLPFYDPSKDRKSGERKSGDAI